VDPDPSSHRQRDLFVRVLADAGISRKSAIRVAGRSGLVPLIWLCRHGFEDVAYLRQGCDAAHADADVVLMLDNTPQAELETLLHRPLHLREGGVLVVSAACRRARGGADPVRAVLEEAGYQIEHCLPRRDGQLHIARRRCTAMRGAA
jgi:hypothetical protein